MDTRTPHPRCEVDIVVLGDAGVGKTELIRRYTHADSTAAAEPTVGVEGTNVTVTLQSGEEVEVTLWDFAGQERYTRLTGRELRGADGCVLVFDLLSHASFEHVSLWHDEFLQNSAGCGAAVAPPFVLVGNKADQVEVAADAAGGGGGAAAAAAVSRDEAVEWCSAEQVDVGLWGGVEAAAVPYCQTSAATGDGVAEAFAAAVERGVRRKRILEEMGAGGAVEEVRVPEEEGEEERGGAAVADAVDVRMCLIGDACTGKSSFIRQCKTGEFFEGYEATAAPVTHCAVQSVDGRRVRLEVVDVPGRDRLGPLPMLRGCHACVIAAAANNAKSLDRARLWREVFLRETGIRDASSVLFVLLHTKADLDDVLADVPSHKARVWADAQGCGFVSCHATEHASAAAALAELAEAAVTRRLDLIYDRARRQSESAAVCRATQESLGRKKLEVERQALVAKHAAAPAYAYVEGKVWAGSKEGGRADAYVESPVYSFPLAIRNLRGDKIDAGEALAGTTAVEHLPLVLEKLADLRNDMSKVWGTQAGYCLCIFRLSFLIARPLSCVTRFSLPYSIPHPIPLPPLARRRLNRATETRSSRCAARISSRFRPCAGTCRRPVGCSRRNDSAARSCAGSCGWCGRRWSPARRRLCCSGSGCEEGGERDLPLPPFGESGWRVATPVGARKEGAADYVL